MPALIPALIVGAGAVTGAAITAGATSNAADAATSAAQANDALQSQIYTQNSANEQPYIQAGDTANTALQGFLGLGGDPAASQAALNNYLNSTGYQFNLQQGEQAAEQNAASSGMLNSGATLKALDAYGTGLADQYGQQYEQNLQGVVNTGEGAANALSGQGQAYANAVSSNNNSAATNVGNAALAGASTDSSLIGNALKVYGTQTGASSFGGASSGAVYNALSSTPSAATTSLVPPGG
jgi:hypothetical protein